MNKNLTPSSIEERVSGLSDAFRVSADPLAQAQTQAPQTVLGALGYKAPTAAVSVSAPQVNLSQANASHQIKPAAGALTGAKAGILQAQKAMIETVNAAKGLISGVMKGLGVEGKNVYPVATSDSVAGVLLGGESGLSMALDVISAAKGSSKGAKAIKEEVAQAVQTQASSNKDSAAFSAPGTGSAPASPMLMKIAEADQGNGKFIDELMSINTNDMAKGSSEFATLANSLKRVEERLAAVNGAAAAVDKGTYVSPSLGERVQMQRGSLADIGGAETASGFPINNEVAAMLRTEPSAGFTQSFNNTPGMSAV